MPVLTDDYETKVTLETGETALPDEMPFRLLLVGDWSGDGSSDTAFGERRPLLIDRDNFEDVMRKMRVELSLDLHGDGASPLKLRFAEIDDFHPDVIFHRVSLFADLRDVRKRLANSQTFNRAAREVRAWTGEVESDESAAAESLPGAAEQSTDESDNLLDQILSQTDVAPEKRKSAPATASKELDNLLGELVRPFIIQTDEAEQAKLIDAVDRAGGELMRRILHQPQFQQLESAWRAARLVVFRTETDTDLKLYLFDVSKDELKNDLKSVGNLTESGFYKLLNEKSIGSRAEESWAAVFGNYFFEPSVDDTAALMRIAQIAADAETPFVAAVSIVETPDASDWKQSADAPEAKLWTMLRDMPQAAYLGLAVLRFMARLPYGAKSEPTESFAFEEFADSAPAHEDYLWANPAFACALLLAQSFRSNGWEMTGNFAQEIENLPMHIYHAGGETNVKPCSELQMTLNAAEKILEKGLMPLLSFSDSDRARLARFQSIAAGSLKGKWNR